MGQMSKQKAQFLFAKIVDTMSGNEPRDYGRHSTGTETLGPLAARCTGGAAQY